MKYSSHILSAIVLVGSLPLNTPAVYAATVDVTFELRPHCEQAAHAAADTEFGGEVPDIEGTMTMTQNSNSPCPSYDVRDPLSRQTPELSNGGTLDMDLVLHNPTNQPLRRYRAWINYDPSVLEGIDIELSDSFPVSTPGEEDFAVSESIIKLSGTANSAVTDSTVVLARITMRVTDASSALSVLSFSDLTGTNESKTGAFMGEGENETNVAALVQSSLAIRLRAAQSTSSTVTSNGVVVSSSSVSNAVTATASTSSVMAPVSSSPAQAALFDQLQVQGLRVTTEGSSAFLAWTPLQSSELAGYNLYYGSVSGRYLQRRSLDANAQTLTIRALPIGTTYYFAIRGVSASGTESDFSQEVAVTIGNPATSTSPLSGSVIDNGPHGNTPSTGGTIAGESGPASWLVIFILLSAAMGTLLAVRRQWIATAHVS